MIDLHKITVKTVIDNKNLQCLGSVDELIERLKKQAEKFKKPQVLIMRSKEKDEVGLYLFEGNFPKIEMPSIDLEMSINKEVNELKGNWIG